MARTYNVIKYVIKKNKDDLKIHGLRLYEFNIKDESIKTPEDKKVIADTIEYIEDNFNILEK